MVQSDLKTSHNAYLSMHPEIRQMMNDFMAAVLANKPDNVREYARDYFTSMAGAPGGGAAQ